MSHAGDQLAFRLPRPPSRSDEAALLDRGADVVFQCRGRSAALALALRLLRPQGTVIDLAFYTDDGAALHLGAEFHHNGLGVRTAQIGRVPRGTAHAWDRERLSAETIALLRAHGAAVRTHVVTDVVPLTDGPVLLADLAARDLAALKVRERVALAVRLRLEAVARHREAGHVVPEAVDERLRAEIAQYGDDAARDWTSENLDPDA